MQVKLREEVNTPFCGQGNRTLQNQVGTTIRDDLVEANRVNFVERQYLYSIIQSWVNTSIWLENGGEDDFSEFSSITVRDWGMRVS